MVALEALASFDLDDIEHDDEHDDVDDGDVGDVEVVVVVVVVAVLGHNKVVVYVVGRLPPLVEVVDGPLWSQVEVAAASSSSLTCLDG